MEYTFKCPKCGSSSVECIQIEKQYCTVELDENGWPYAGDVMDSDILENPEYRCADCFHTVTAQELRDIALSSNQE